MLARYKVRQWFYTISKLQVPSLRWRWLMWSCPVWRVIVRPTEGPPTHSSSSTASFVAHSHRKSRRTPSSRRCTGNSPPPPPSQRQLLHRQIWTLPPLESGRKRKTINNLVIQQRGLWMSWVPQKSEVLVVHLVVTFKFQALFKWFMERVSMHIIWGQMKAKVVKECVESPIPWACYWRIAI